VEKYKTSENGHGITRSFSSHNALQRQGLWPHLLASLGKN
jgi:hypothetical protein